MLLLGHAALIGLGDLDDTSILQEKNSNLMQAIYSWAPAQTAASPLSATHLFQLHVGGECLLQSSQGALQTPPRPMYATGLSFQGCLGSAGGPGVP